MRGIIRWRMWIQHIQQGIFGFTKYQAMVKKQIIGFVLLLFAFSSFSQTNDDNMLIIFVENQPVFKGDLKKFVQNEIVYPASAKKGSVEGIVVISFWVDTLGFTSDHEIIRGIREDLDNEALRVTKLIKFEKPAFQRGKPIQVKYTFPVEFYLSDTKHKSKGKKK